MVVAHLLDLVFVVTDCLVHFLLEPSLLVVDPSLKSLLLLLIELFELVQLLLTLFIHLSDQIVKLLLLGVDEVLQLPLPLCELLLAALELLHLGSVEVLELADRLFLCSLSFSKLLLES